ELSGFGLVTVAEDGRHRRAYPTDLLVRKREANRSRADAFGEALLGRLADDGLAPELLRRDETTLTVRFGAGPRRGLLEVPPGHPRAARIRGGTHPLVRGRAPDSSRRIAES